MKRIVLWVFILLIIRVHPTEAREPVKVAVDENLPPFEYVENGQVKGFNIDIINEIAKVEGLVIEFVPMKWHQTAEALQQGEVDIILGMNYTAKRAEEFDFTEGYFVSYQALFVPIDSEINSITDLKEKVVGVQRDAVALSLLENVRQVHLHVASDQEIALELLTIGRVDASIVNRWTGKYFLQKKGLENEYLIVSGNLQPFEYAMAIRKGNHDLLNKLNRGLFKIRQTGSYGEIYASWFKESLPQLTAKLQKILTLSLTILGVASGFLVVGAYWNKQLKVEVKKRTKSLQEQIKLTKESDAFKEQIFSSVPSGIVTIDLAGKITSINYQAKLITGIDEISLGKHYSNIDLLARIINGVPKEKPDNKIKTGNKVIKYTICSLKNTDKQKVGNIITLRDITEDEELRLRLMQNEKNQALSQLVAGIAHEIRNPLTAIKTFIELIPIKYSNDKFREEIANHVPKEIERIDKIVIGLLDYAKPKEPALEAIDLQKLVEDILVLFSKRIESNKIKLSLKVQANPQILADRDQLKQVLINILLNALDSITNNGQIDIIIWVEDDKAYLEVNDNGLGIPEKYMAKIFDPFFTTKSNGTGLGLPLSYQYVNENGGELKVSSILQHGTKVTLSFPVYVGG